MKVRIAPFRCRSRTDAGLLKPVIGELAQRRLIDEFDSARLIALVGNGGSASIASHLATDLWTQARKQSYALADVGALTAAANDYGFDQALWRWLESLPVLSKPWVLVAMSCSGTSLNVIKAARWARARKGSVVVLTGASGTTPLALLGDLVFCVKSRSTGAIQVAHHAILHAACDQLAKRTKR